MRAFTIPFSAIVALLLTTVSQGLPMMNLDSLEKPLEHSAAELSETFADLGLTHPNQRPIPQLTPPHPYQGGLYHEPSLSSSSSSSSSSGTGKFKVLVNKIITKNSGVVKPTLQRSNRLSRDMWKDLLRQYKTETGLDVKKLEEALSDSAQSKETRRKSRFAP